MSRFEQPTLVRYSSIATDEGQPVRPFRPRTLVYGGLLTMLPAASVVLLLGRVSFEATVNRAPGSLFAVDADGYVRNTYLLKITNKGAADGDVVYQIHVDGFDEAEMTTTSVTVPPEQTQTVPIIIRVPEAGVTRRTIPFTLRVAGTTEELLLPITFKTGASIGGDD